MSALSTPPISPPSNLSPKPRDVASLPPLITSPLPESPSPLPVSDVHVNNAPFPHTETPPPPSSRPLSAQQPSFLSSLPYTLVRDFAYPTSQPSHYGLHPEVSRTPSATSTPTSERPSYLDQDAAWRNDDLTKQDSWRESRASRAQGLEPIQFGDGPPWSEDEDLQSPIVVSSRHKKHKSASDSFTDYGFDHDKRSSKRWHGRADSQPESERGPYAPYNALEDSTYHTRALNGSQDSPVDDTDERGLSSYAPHESRLTSTTLPSRSFVEVDDDHYDSYSDTSSPDHFHDESRYSRDYQFTIASPDEEMHGKAVALFDFERENENELPLIEGQVIWVSYRHGQGWLVAEDPKTHESGLVPEEYVRLLRDIKGGLHSLTGQLEGIDSTTDKGTPTHTESGEDQLVGNGYQQPVVSTFSTSSKDLRPYPQHLLGTQAGMAPPQVVHYHGQRGGSQANTPTFPNVESEELLPDVPGVTRSPNDE